MVAQNIAQAKQGHFWEYNQDAAWVFQAIFDNE